MSPGTRLRARILCTPDLSCRITLAISGSYSFKASMALSAFRSYFGVFVIFLKGREEIRTKNQHWILTPQECDNSFFKSTIFFKRIQVFFVSPVVCFCIHNSSLQLNVGVRQPTLLYKLIFKTYRTINTQIIFLIMWSTVSSGNSSSQVFINQLLFLFHFNEAVQATIATTKLKIAFHH